MSKLQPRLTGRPLLSVVWMPIIPMPTKGSASLCSRTVRDDYTSRTAPPLSITQKRGKNTLSVLVLYLRLQNFPWKAN